MSGCGDIKVGTSIAARHSWGLLLQATKGKQKLAFFTMPEYEAWKETAAPGWTIKYYKGLGTSDKKEAQEYFADIDLHRKTFVHQGVQLHLTLAHCTLSSGSRTPAAVWTHSAV